MAALLLMSSSLNAVEVEELFVDEEIMLHDCFDIASSWADGFMYAFGISFEESWAVFDRFYEGCMEAMY